MLTKTPNTPQRPQKNLASNEAILDFVNYSCASTTYILKYVFISRFWLYTTFIILTLFTSLKLIAKDTNISKKIQIPPQIQKLLPTPIGIAGDGNRYGHSISINDNRAIIGAPYMATTGLVYVYDYDGFNWNQTTVLSPNNFLDTESNFGISVSLHNNRILVGASKRNNSNMKPSGSAFIFDLINGNWSQTQEIVPTNNSQDEYFGYSVSLLNDKALIGAYRDVESPEGSGSAYVFNLVAGTWVESQKLVNEFGRRNDYFGYSVDLAENRLLIGAHKNEEDGSSNNGAAFIFDFENETWSLTQKLNANIINDNDNFGYSVSLSGDQALIGAYRNDISNIDAGAAYIFNFDGSSWQQSSILLPSLNNTPKYFGKYVQIENNQAIIGTTYHISNEINSGATYIFNKNNGQWLQTQIIHPNDGENDDLFGAAISLSNSTLFVSSITDDDSGINSGSVYSFKSINGIWQEDNKLVSDELIGASLDSFGISVSYQGNRVVIGSHLDDDEGFNSGSAYIFDLIDNDWNLTQKISADVGIEGGFFGHSVSLSGDRVLIGAPNGRIYDTGEIGSAYIFDLINGTWTQTQKINASDEQADNKFGFSLSLFENKALVGAYGNGSAYIYNLSNGNWIEDQKLNPLNESLSGEFGYSVSLNQNRLLIGARRAPNEPDGNSRYRRGAAYIFDFINNQWTQSQKLFDPNVITGSYLNADFGSSVSLFNNRAAIGARFDDVFDIFGSYSMGSAYIFDYNETTWIPTQKIIAEDFGGNDIFGMSISLYEDKVVVGASRNRFNGSYTGASYVFDYQLGNWTQTKKIQAIDGNRIDRFGSSISLYENKVFIGANSDDTEAGSNSGSVYFYNLSEFIFANGFEG